MTASDSMRAAQVRRDTWRRRHDRRGAAPAITSMTAIQPPAQLAELLVTLSRGHIGPEAARDIVGIAKGATTVEIIVDAETGLVESWSMRTGGSVGADAASVMPTTLAPAA